MFLINETRQEAQFFDQLVTVFRKIMQDDRLTGRDIRVLLAVLSLGGLSHQQRPIPMA